MIIGITLVFSVLILASIVLYCFVKGQIKWALIITIILGIGLKVYCSLDGRLHDWDERYHALVAKNMIEQPLKPMLYKNPVLPYDYKNWAGNHIWLHKQPIPLWLMSASISLFGTNVFSVRLISIILSSLLILLIYGLGNELFNKKVGIIAAFLFAINGFVLEIGSGRASTDHIELVFLFFVTFSIWLSVLGAKLHSYLYVFLVGLTLGLAILTKWLPALIVLPIWLLLSLQYRQDTKFIIKSLIMISGVSFFVFFPWQWYILNTFPVEANYEYDYNRRHIYEALGTEISHFSYNIKYLRIKFGEFLYFPMLVLCVFLFKKGKARYHFKFAMIWVWIFIPLLFFTFVKTKMPGYILFTVPALYILSGYIWTFFNQKYHKNTFFKVLSIIILFILPLRYTFERVKPFDHRFLRSYNEKYGPNEIVFNDPYNIETMFFTDCYASYPYAPAQKVIDSLTNVGFKVVIK
jgi:4-amino-4-deoxy-L-arabinose transferase-like glycosyltransferase